MLWSRKWWFALVVMTVALGGGRRCYGQAGENEGEEEPEVTGWLAAGIGGGGIGSQGASFFGQSPQYRLEAVAGRGRQTLSLRWSSIEASVAHP